MSENTTKTPEQGQTNVVDLSSPLTIYNATEAALAKIKADYGNLTIAGINDKDGYKAVADGLRIVVGLRNKVDKRRQELKRHIDAGSKAILTELEPVEKHLRDQKDAIDNEAARLEQEAKEAELRKFNNRTSGLFALGFHFNGAIYTLGKMALTADQIQKASDFEFGKWIEQGTEIAAEIQRAKEAEAARLAEIERREKELAEREAKLSAQAPPAETPSAPIETVPARGVEVREVEGTTRPTPPKVDFTPAATAAVTETTRPAITAQYLQGFGACRNKVIEILNSPDKFTRAQLIEKINNLTA
jgi:Skp family chaperone for outer membrane proteins